MQPTKIRTGALIPRDYGIVHHQQGRRIFISPLDYVLGGFLLASPDQIRQALQDKARRDQTSFPDLYDAFLRGVKRKEHETRAMEHEGRDILDHVEKYDGFTGEVLSKSAERKDDNHVFLQYTDPATKGLAYDRVRCECQDNFWNYQHGMETMDPHLAALEIALITDNRTRKNTSENITGLPPRERQVPDSIPFQFGRIAGTQAIDILCDYYINNKNHFTINKDLLEHKDIYGPRLRNTFRQDPAALTYQVLRQRERTVPKTDQNQRTFGAIRALQHRIMDRLEQQGFTYQGLGLEFKNTPHEDIALRYGRGDRVYALLTPKGMPPLVVHKRLGSRPKQWLDSTDVRADLPYRRCGLVYTAIDDTTRREAWTTILLPGINMHGIYVQDQLSQQYQRLSRKP